MLRTKMENKILKALENTEINKENSAEISKKEKSAENTNEISRCEKNFSFTESPSLEEIRKRVETFCKDRNWEQYHTPRNLLLGIHNLKDVIFVVVVY